MYLFGNSALSGYIGKMLDAVGITERIGAVNFLRHAKISELFNNAPTEEARLKLSKEMKHSSDTQKKYVRLIDNSLLVDVKPSDFKYLEQLEKKKEADAVKQKEKPKRSKKPQAVVAKVVEPVVKRRKIQKVPK